jgi:hypothetical protein
VDVYGGGVLRCGGDFAGRVCIEEVRVANVVFFFFFRRSFSVTLLRFALRRLLPLPSRCRNSRLRGQKACKLFIDAFLDERKTAQLAFLSLPTSFTTLIEITKARTVLPVSILSILARSELVESKSSFPFLSFLPSLHSILCQLSLSTSTASPLAPAILLNLLTTTHRLPSLSRPSTFPPLFPSS